MQQSIEVLADWDSIATLMAFTDSVESRMPLTADQRYLMRLVIEEIATNIVKYGYSDANRDVIQLDCSYEGGTLRIHIRDRGESFDPRDHPDPDLSDADAASRDVGGLGLYFVREFADDLTYQHDASSGWNELTVIKGR
ncbi:ATP-binding protein [Oscillochloris sp. ZM17-4]|uniref:ATP-binding protein n=1 Tax=Oscillochloris sp. ZM17-4 TaxID=2866714 RepID=UPI00210247CD|nr:ATP-binding protein [Oscillochloris sp. ZM17-4]